MWLVFTLLLMSGMMRDNHIRVYVCHNMAVNAKYELFISACKSSQPNVLLIRSAI